MTDELKEAAEPCPFCGNVAVKVNMPIYGEVVGCGQGDCAGRHVRVPVSIWNERATHQPIPEQVAGGEDREEDALKNQYILGYMDGYKEAKIHNPKILPLPAETGAAVRVSEENVELVENALCRVCEAENTYELCPDNVQLTKLAKAAITALQTKGDHHG